MSEKDFSVIMLFGRRRLEPGLSSLLSQEGVNFEIIAVGDFEPGEIEDPRIKFLKIVEQNPAMRRNQAVRISAGNWLAFIDDDAIAPKDWLSKAKAIFKTRPELAGFGGTNIAPLDLSWREKLVELILTDSYFGSGSKAYKISQVSHLARPGEIHLSNFFLKKEIFERLKGFNEKIGYGAEDSELVYQIKKRAGLDLGFFPELFVIHQRRKWGWEWFKRNFRFRRQNGRLLWLYPDMYLWNRSLWAGIAVFFLGLIILLIYPKLFLGLILFYFCSFMVMSFVRLKTDKWLCLISPFAYLGHHLSYLSGLLLGVLEGVFRRRSKIQKLLGREDFEEKKNQ